MRSARLTDVTDSLPAAVFQMKRAADGEVSFPYIGGDRRLFPALRIGGAAVSSLAAPWTLPPEDTARLEAVLDATTDADSTISLDFRIGRDTPARWLQFHAVPRPEADGGTLWSGYWSDTTQEHARARTGAGA